MIYVQIKAVKSEGRGSETSNGWHDTASVFAAIARELEHFHDMYEALGGGDVATYRITVATEASPRRTRGARAGLPLPVAHGEAR